MKTYLGCLLTLLCLSAATVGTAAPPVVRSTFYDGSSTNIIRYLPAPWMSSTNVHLTVEAWVYCEDLDYAQTFVARHNSTNLWFGLYENRLRFYRSGGTFADSDATLVVRRWTHVAVTYNGSTAKFFINGTNAGTSALAHEGNDSTNSLCLGGQRDVLNFGDLFTGGYAFHGYLDEVRLWSEARTAAEIALNMDSEIRSGPGLLAAFGSGGDRDDIHGTTGTSIAPNVAARESGFGILPRGLCIPWTSRTLTADGVVDLLYEYRGAETMVLRSSDPFSSAPDQPAYLMRSYPDLPGGSHLYVGVPALPQAGLPQVPRLQVKCDVNPTNSDAPDLGDWEARLTQDGLQGGTRYVVADPPFQPAPHWASWGQSFSNWSGATAGAFEFRQSYEFRIHEDHLNHFTNGVGLVVQYGDALASGELLTAPGDALTNRPTTYAPATWCAQAVTGLRSASYSGVVSNVTLGAGEAGWTVSLLSGPNPLSATEIDSVVVGSSGAFLVGGSVPAEFPTYVRLGLRSGYGYLPPEFTGAGVLPADMDGNTSLTYPACSASCSAQSVRFRVQSPPGPVSVTGMTPTTGSPELVLRDTPRKALPSTIVTLTGTNLHPALEVYLSKCNLDPPSSCTEDVDIFRCTILSNDFERRTLTVQLPAASANPNFVGAMQWVFKDNDIGHPGWTPWVYGPSDFVVTRYHPYPVLHGFEFKNEDDGPSLQEFEACYGESIFIYTPFPLRDPYYALWSIVYMIWMDGCRSSCHGMASTSRLLEEGTIPLETFDAPGAGGVHGVHFANGYVGTSANPLLPPKPGWWSGFDLFQPFRPVNLWAQITTMAGAQTSGEALGFWLTQLEVPVRFGPRRGHAAGDPLEVLARVRTAPGEYILAIQDRDYGRGHCLTPYAVQDERGLMADALTPTNAPGFSLIKVYDNNHPGEERFVEVNRTENTFRYEGGIDGGPYLGPGLFWIPMSVFWSPRHAPGPDFLGRFGVDSLRVLAVGTERTSFTTAAGETAGWSADGLHTNDYGGAQHFLALGALPDGANRFDTTMLFLPASNAPLAGAFNSRGSNVLLYAAMGWGDMAFGFHAPDNEASNVVDGLVMSEALGLQAMGFRAGAPVRDFGIIVASRTGTAAQRLFEIDAGVDELTPNVLVSRVDALGLKLRNRSSSALVFRLNISGVDLDHSAFAHTYGVHTLPPLASVTFRLPPGPPRRLTRELDLDSDGTPETTEEVPAAGQLRADRESGQLALRWRRAASSETLESASKIAAAPWTPVGASVTTEGPDQVARVSTPEPTRFYRLKISSTNCFDLSAKALGPRPNPWDTNGWKFETLSAFGAMQSQNQILTRDDHTGLDVQHTLRLHPHDDYQVIHLDVYQTSGLVTFEAVGALGAVVARATLTGIGTNVQRVTLRGFRDRLHYIRMISPNAQCLLVNVCGEREAQTVVTPQPPACLSFENFNAQVLNNPTLISLAEFSSAPGPLEVEPVLGLNVNGMRMNGTFTVTLGVPNAIGPCDRITLRLRNPQGDGILQAYNDTLGIFVDGANTVAAPGEQTVVLQGSGITRFWFYANSQDAHLLEICVEPSVP